jgi:hypothetical protein
MDISFPFQPANVAKAFSERIRTGCFSFKNTDAASVLEFLYTAYADVQDRDPKEIDQGFISLDNHLSKSVSLDENNEIFGIVCSLCDAYEKRAFIDAIQIGAYLMLELQGK